MKTLQTAPIEMLRPARLEDLADQLEQFEQDLDGSSKLQKRIEGIVDRLDKVHDEIKAQGQAHSVSQSGRVKSRGRLPG